MRPRRAAGVATVCVCAALLTAGRRAPGVIAADEVLQRTRAAYGALRSYADTGVITYEYGRDGREQYTFSTAFVRAPRHFLLDFTKPTGDRFVIWGDPDAFHTWWKTTGQRFDYPNPNNTPAISQSGQTTHGAALKVPTLLYEKARLGGDFDNFADQRLDGTESIDGRSCYRLSGTTGDVYAATGREVNVRRVGLWIDTESLLIRKMVEDAEAPPGQKNRTTTMYQPQANPVLDDAAFRFVPPSGS